MQIIAIGVEKPLAENNKMVERRHAVLIIVEDAYTRFEREVNLYLPLRRSHRR